MIGVAQITSRTVRLDDPSASAAGAQNDFWRAVGFLHDGIVSAPEIAVPCVPAISVVCTVGVNTISIITGRGLIVSVLPRRPEEKVMGHTSTVVVQYIKISNMIAKA